MKKLIYIALIAMMMVSCGHKQRSKESSAGNDKRNEITSFYINSMTLSDVKKKDNTDPQQFLNDSQLSNLQSCMQSFLDGPDAKVYSDPSSAPADKKEISKSLKERGSIVKNWNRVEFYESWYFNSENSMIEKEALGYSVFEYVPDKEAFRLLYYVFRDDAALEKAKKYYFSL